MKKSLLSYQKEKHKMPKIIPIKEYTTLQDAYDLFNQEFFNGELPNCMITFTNKGKRNLGFFHPSKFYEREGKEVLDELGLNPTNFNGQSDKDILALLLHEVCHVWQQYHGTPSRNGYHNKEWGDKMKEVGLFPSNTGLPGGKEKGQQMMHYVIPNGKFEQLYVKWEKLNVRLKWQSFSDIENEKGKQKTVSKVKYTCPKCEQNAWAKPNAKLICGECEEVMECQL